LVIFVGAETLVAVEVFVGVLVAVEVFVGVLVAVGWVGHATSTRQSPMPPTA
jgi:hypothetical protein